MQLELVAVTKDEDMNVIIGQTHFIKSVEDIYEAVVNAVPGVTNQTQSCLGSFISLGRNSPPNLRSLLVMHSLLHEACVMRQVLSTYSSTNKYSPFLHNIKQSS